MRMRRAEWADLTDSQRALCEDRVGERIAVWSEAEGLYLLVEVPNQRLELLIDVLADTNKRLALMEDQHNALCDTLEALWLSGPAEETEA